MKNKRILLLLSIALISTLIMSQLVYASAPTIKKIDNLSVAVNVGAKYSLPSQVKATMTDRKQKNAAVKWNVNTVNTSKSGVFKYTGTVKNYSKKILLTLNVKAAANVNNSTTENSSNNGVDTTSSATKK